MDINEIIDNFNLFEEWEDKYIYLIELGSKLPEFDDNLKRDEFLVKGCQSRVWLIHNVNDSNNAKVLNFKADSDSQIVKGLIYILLSVYSGKSPSEIKKIEIKEILSELQLEKHLSGNRTNGLNAMIDKIKFYAEEQIN